MLLGSLMYSYVQTNYYINKVKLVISDLVRSLIGATYSNTYQIFTQICLVRGEFHLSDRREKNLKPVCKLDLEGRMRGLNGRCHSRTKQNYCGAGHI